MIRAVFLSSFDVLEGPKISYSVPAFDTRELGRFKSVPKLIDMVDNEQFLINTLENIYSANYYFSMTNNFVRGNKSLLLLSLVIEVNANDKKEEILVFLGNVAPLLRGFAQKMANDATLKDRGGILSRENMKRVMDMLHEFHAQSFANKEFEALMEGRKGKIVVVGQDGINSKKIFDRWRAHLVSEVTPDLKTRMAIHAIKEMEFHEFHCLARNSELCREEECPVCNELGSEADVIIYIIDTGSFDMDEDIKGFLKYFNGFTKRRDIPFFIFVLVPALANKEQGNAFIATFKEKLKEKSPAAKFIENMHVYALDGNDTVTFKRAMSDLIKLVV